MIDKLLLAILIAYCASSACAQDASEYSAESQTDAYLVERGLDEVLAARLRVRLRTAKGEERTGIAESLGRVYARQLEAVDEQDERKAIEVRCRELIDSVPDVESYGLRIELARTLYLSVESDAEGSRLLLGSPEQTAEAIRVLQSVVPQFEALAKRLQNECERIQRRMDDSDDADANVLRERLEEYRGFRSRAAYYAGWSSYYLAMLKGDKSHALGALDSFGIILGAVPGNPANLERVNKGFIRFPHYARSMIGCALSASALGRDVEALRWLDVLDSAEDKPSDVSDQLFARYAIVLAESDRWNDLVVRLRIHRQGLESGRLSKSEARLVAVLALQAATKQGMLPRTREMIEEIAQFGLTDLIARGEVAHVKNLFQIFGTAPIADQGFVALYLRGSDAFEKTREAHAAQGGDVTEPATDATIMTNYRSCAELLRGAVESQDAASFPAEWSRAMVRRGLALFFAGDLEESVEVLERAGLDSTVDEDRKEALWFAIVASDRAVRSGRISYRERCDRLTAEYVKRHPGTDKSVSLLSRLIKSGLIDDDAAIATLLGVAADSPMFLTARSEAVGRLYAKFSKVAGQDRDLVALRVAEIGEDVIKRYYEITVRATGTEANDAAERLILRSRQVVDALLSISSPDIARASSLLALISSTADRLALDISSVEPEMCYHRLRIAQAAGDKSEERRVLTRLSVLSASVPGAMRYLDAGQHLHLLKVWSTYADSDYKSEFAPEVIKTVQALISRSDGTVTERMRGVYAKGAEAAHRIWVETGDAAARDLSMDWDQRLNAVVRNAPSMRRLAMCFAALGRSEDSIIMWNEILAGTAERSEPWFEARWNSIFLIHQIRPSEAADALRQFRVLYLEPPPEPWRTRFDELELKISRPTDATGGGK